jgi:hypothetical protein
MRVGTLALASEDLSIIDIPGVSAFSAFFQRLFASITSFSK